MLEESNHPGNLACAAILNARHPVYSQTCGLTLAQVQQLWLDFINGVITAGDFKAFLGAAFNSGDA
jgi:hypothetical protein